MQKSSLHNFPVELSFACQHLAVCCILTLDSTSVSPISGLDSLDYFQCLSALTIPRIFDVTIHARFLNTFLRITELVLCHSRASVPGNSEMSQMTGEYTFFVRRFKSLYSFQKESTRSSLASTHDWPTNA